MTSIDKIHAEGHIISCFAQDGLCSLMMCAISLQQIHARDMDL